MECDWQTECLNDTELLWTKSLCDRYGTPLWLEDHWNIWDNALADINSGKTSKALLSGKYTTEGVVSKGAKVKSEGACWRVERHENNLNIIG